MAIELDDGLLYVRIDDDQLQRLILSTLSPTAMKRVQNRAINETTAWIKSQMLKQLPGITDIPRKLLNNRVRISKAKAGVFNNAVRGVVWIGMNPIDAIDLPDKGPSGSGYKTGQQFYEGGFKAFYKTRTSSLGIFARKDNRRLPIRRQNVAIDTFANQVVRRLIPQAQRALAQKTERLISYELERNAR